MLSSPIIDKVDVPGGFIRRFPIPERMKDLRDPMFDFCDSPEIVVEIGSQWGWWAHRAAKCLPQSCTIYCVDPWSNKPKDIVHWRGGDSNMHEWCMNVKPWLGTRVFGLRGKSEDIAPDFDDEVDLLFVDGDHLQATVIRDLELWIPKLSKGGVAVGHDWGGPWGKGVRRAVTEYFKRKRPFSVEKVYWSMRGKELSPCWVWRN